jgi:hypothetical protein
MPHRGCGRDRRAITLITAFIPQADVIAGAHHLRLFPSDAMGDEPSVVPGFPFVRAVMADEVARREVTNQIQIELSIGNAAVTSQVRTYKIMSCSVPMHALAVKENE